MRYTKGTLVATGLLIALVAVTRLEQPLWRSNYGANNIVTIKPGRVTISTTRDGSTQRNLDDGQMLPVTIFQKWTNPFPCYSDHKGLIFIKIKKCASTTTRNIVRRIAYRHKPVNMNSNKATKNHSKHCSEQSKHNPASILHYIPDRSHTKSYLFSFVREPTSRFVSHFYYAAVSRKGIIDNLENFKVYTREIDHSTDGASYENEFKVMGGYQMNYLTTSKNDLYPALPLGTYWDEKDPSVVHHPEELVQRISKIIQEYNFIGVVERFDESLVALSFLLDLSLGDIIYAKSEKHAGSYELLHEEEHLKCVKLVDKNVTPDWDEFLQSSEWKAQIAGDSLLYGSVDESLDKTIDYVIGRESFEKRLDTFKELMEYSSVDKGCGDDKYLECSSTGEKTPVPCKDFHSHLDCQYDCLDRSWVSFLKHRMPKSDEAAS